jgi:hypothetical protein
MSALAQKNVLGEIEALLAEFNGEKRASEMGTSGSGKDDPGGYDGKSSHPSAMADPKSGPATLGARAKENEKDVKAEYPGQIDNHGSGFGDTQDNQQPNMGMHQSATGEDSKVEEDYKFKKDDPGTSSPAKADTGSDKQGSHDKYASMSHDQLFKEAYTQLNGLLAALADGEEIHLDAAGQKKEASTTTTPSISTTTQTATETPAQAAQRGYELASGLTNPPAFDKTALAHAVLENLYREAENDADNVIEYLQARNAAIVARTKAANAPGMPPPGPGAGMPPPPPGPPGGGEMATGPEMGGMPPGAEGGDPAAAGAGGHEAALEEMMSALVEQGIPVEDIIAAAQAAGGGGAGAPPEEAGMAHPGMDAGAGMPPPGPEMGGMPKGASTLSALAKHMATNLKQQRPEVAQALYKVASDVKKLVETKGVKIKAAKQGTRLRAERDEIKGYLREVCGV